MRYIDADKIDYKFMVLGQDEYAGYRAVAFESDIDDMPTADVAPSSEVERLYYNLQAVLEERAETKREIAMGIIEELETLIHKYGVINCHKVDELKKKYTGAKDD